MNYMQAQNVSAAAQRNNYYQNSFNTNNLNPYQIELLKTIQTLHYKKFEIENHLLLAQHQFTQTTQNQYATQIPTPILSSNQIVHENPNDQQNPENAVESESVLEVLETNTVLDKKDQDEINQEEINIVCENEDKNSQKIDETFSYKNIINQHKVDEINKKDDLSILFKKFCKSCNYNKPNKFCKYIHENDENYYFYTLPLNKRCLRSVCFDLICMRVHHTLTKRLSIRCDKNPCFCKHYVHQNDTNENKPYFWKSYEDSLPKPSHQECKDYFLLKIKEKK